MDDVHVGLEQVEFVLLAGFRAHVLVGQGAPVEAGPWVVAEVERQQSQLGVHHRDGH